MTDNNTVQNITNYCKDKLPLKTIILPNEYYYSSLPLCVIDSVFSIGVRYEGVTNTVKRVSKHYKIKPTREDKNTLPEIEKQILPTSNLLKRFDEESKGSIEYLVSNVFKNKQRTSPRGGILKVEAVKEFLKVLKEFKIEYFQDVAVNINNNDLDSRIKLIKGQTSGISLKYFFMLAGTENLIKPDTMIKRFLKNATGSEYNDQQCQDILSMVTLELKGVRHDLNPRLLDYAIWSYERKQTPK